MRDRIARRVFEASLSPHRWEDLSPLERDHFTSIAIEILSISRQDDVVQLSHRIYEINREHGFPEWRGALIPEGLAHLHCELSEAFQVWRTTRPEDDDWMPDEFVEELADVFIRLLDLVAGSSIGTSRFLKITEAKVERNRTRPFKHGKRS